eukprot:TRINITY_DN10582_c0_g1_i3.p2 TRINITY_DN10582_c0_g1~~TRINITY_DN10582_c0_g1_i3.p2  ORF type:complete len:198 (-),score=15.95 TRINITY_DN10582_c0_g1_i3:247-840(-)
MLPFRGQIISIRSPAAVGQRRVCSAICDGQGWQIWSDGTYVEGSFEDGECHGFGSCSYRDGTIYCGEFKKGLRHGRGLLYRLASNDSTCDNSCIGPEKRQSVTFGQPERRRQIKTLRTGDSKIIILQQGQWRHDEFGQYDGAKPPRQQLSPKWRPPKSALFNHESRESITNKSSLPTLLRYPSRKHHKEKRVGSPAA